MNCDQAFPIHRTGLTKPQGIMETMPRRSAAVRSTEVPVPPPAAEQTAQPSHPSAPMRDYRQTFAASSPKPRSSRPLRDLHRCRTRRRLPPAAPRIIGLRPTGSPPVLQSTKFELVINQQTARMLGVVVRQYSASPWIERIFLIYEYTRMTYQIERVLFISAYSRIDPLFSGIDELPLDCDLRYIVAAADKIPLMGWSSRAPAPLWNRKR